MNETPSQTVGPFFKVGLDWMPGLVTGHRDGSTIELTGTVHDATGPVPDAMLEFSHATQFARALTEPDGSYAVTLRRPGTNGEGRTPCIDVSVFARGLLQRLVTRIYLPDEARADERDPVLASVPASRRDTLFAQFTKDHRLRYDLHLQGPRETVFFAY